ncbi:MAG: hypothetical protein RL708_2182 [Bacteroidota bacterium]|jgi:hypothetical protein
MIDIKITDNKPIDEIAWNELAKSNGNLIQATYSDEVQQFFQHQSIYLHVIENGKLIAAYKFYKWESKRLPTFIRSISQSISFIGEPIIWLEIMDTRKDEIRNIIESELKKYVAASNPATAIHGNYYGRPITLNSLFNPTTKKEYNIAIINVSKSEEDLWSNVHSKHRNVIRKAEKENVKIKEDEHIETFIKLMQSTYEKQPDKAPNYSFITTYFSILKKQNLVSIYIAYHNNEALIGAFITKFGATAYYAFGGSTSNSLGAGNLLQWHIMKELKKEKITFYNLGQVARADDDSNFKFSKGISSFKRRFGVFELPGVSEKYILRPFANQVWNLLVKVFIKK